MPPRELIITAVRGPQVLAEVEGQMEPEAIAATLGRRALHVQLHGINGLRANNLLAASAAGTRGAGGGYYGKNRQGPRARSLFIRYGRFCLEKPLSAE